MAGSGQASGTGGVGRDAAVAGAGGEPPKLACQPGLCAPGGTCVESAGDYRCDCQTGFSGTGTKQCVNIDDCLGNPCAPGGSCVDGIGTYSCTCGAGYSGTGTKSCLNINDCSANACTPGGSCVDGVASYSCTCNSGFSGTGTKQCTNIDDCPANACAPGGRCLDGINSYSCQCSGPPGPQANTCPYSDGGDGTIYDSTTGTTWQKTRVTGIAPANNGAPQNVAYCSGLSLAGGGWRLPTLDEFNSMAPIFPDPGCYAIAHDVTRNIDGACFGGAGTDMFYIRCVR
jgi:hypothetical protein